MKRMLSRLKAALLAKRIAAHWDARTTGSKPARTNWWESRMIREHVNRLVAGRIYPVFSEGLLNKALQAAAGRVFERGISVGCGIGNKEMNLIKKGLVRSFDLYELSAERVAKGRQLAVDWGLTDAVRFHREDALQHHFEETVDLVHWNNSLHHMLDVDGAVSWSWRALSQGGMFYMDDYVGPPRFQWSDESLSLATRLRTLLPERYLRNPLYPDHPAPYIDRVVKRPRPGAIARKDPSEAVQSDRIIAAVMRHFPNAEITYTGGTVYHLTLNTILHNFDETDETDRALLGLMLIIDELTTRIPELDNHYATAIAWKT